MVGICTREDGPVLFGFEHSPLLTECLVLYVSGYSALWLRVPLCAKCTLHICYWSCLHPVMRNRATPLIWGSYFKSWWHLAAFETSSQYAGLFSAEFWKREIFDGRAGLQNNSSLCINQKSSTSQIWKPISFSLQEVRPGMAYRCLDLEL